MRTRGHRLQHVLNRLATGGTLLRLPLQELLDPSEMTERLQRIAQLLAHTADHRLHQRLSLTRSQRGLTLLAFSEHLFQETLLQQSPYLFGHLFLLVVAPRSLPSPGVSRLSVAAACNLIRKTLQLGTQSLGIIIAVGADQIASGGDLC